MGNAVVKGVVIDICRRVNQREREREREREKGWEVRMLMKTDWAVKRGRLNLFSFFRYEYRCPGSLHYASHCLYAVFMLPAIATETMSSTRRKMEERDKRNQGSQDGRT